MSTNAKHLSISRDDAIKALDAAMMSEIDKRKIETPLPTDWTMERLVENGLTKEQARIALDKMVDSGLGRVIFYRRANGYKAKAVRAK